MTPIFQNLTQIGLPDHMMAYLLNNPLMVHKIVIAVKEGAKVEMAMDQAENTAMERPASMLEKADATINGPRQSDYGDKLTNFSQISMLWQGMLAPKLLPDSRITPEDVALLMILVKMSRLAKTPDHFDSILDIAGYAGCYDHIQKDRAAGKKLKGALRDARASE